MIAENSNVQVVVRLRPPDDPSENVEETFIYEPDRPHVLSIRDPLSNLSAEGRGTDHSFMFHKVLMPKTQQSDIFEEVARPLVSHVLQGFNACCFAYGQTYH